ncbi:MAG: hypothetical protein WCT54_00695 [Patescibacteria group bacterium]
MTDGLDKSNIEPRNLQGGFLMSKSSYVFSKSQRRAVRTLLSRVRRKCSLAASSNALRAKLRNEVAAAVADGERAASILDGLMARYEPKRGSSSVAQIRCNVCGRYTQHKNDVCTAHEFVFCNICTKSTLRLNGDPCKNHSEKYCQKCDATTYHVDGACIRGHALPALSSFSSWRHYY